MRPKHLPVITQTWGSIKQEDVECTCPLASLVQLGRTTLNENPGWCREKEEVEASGDREEEMGRPHDLVGKESTCTAGDPDSIRSPPSWGRLPGEGNGNPSSILAWRIQWTEEPGGLQSMGSQRVGHDLATKSLGLQAGKESSGKIQRRQAWEVTLCVWVWENNTTGPSGKTTQPSRAVNLISGFLIGNGNSHKYSCSLVLVNN